MDLKKAVWRKASRSTNNGGNCVEVASTSDVVAIRDSKNPDGGMVVVGREEARALVERIKNA
ncbi:hypothetical protein GCM10009678_12980 [Actinomadura kijaniata]|uniref:DUF397 domain-containing protein n=1 Tax=Actinomadura namibiensis TaxID=182080 RepID=A0A7W3LNM8_ACTNM|nr:DUF397 domain-containing protein [Actinomadura namibiensis]MBA8951424.1 hypothetical protein [Actinomadura namibiensis]